MYKALGIPYAKNNSISSADKYHDLSLFIDTCMTKYKFVQCTLHKCYFTIEF